MATNANGNLPSASDSIEKDEPSRGGKFSVDRVLNALIILPFLGCWIIFGVIIFNYLTSIGTPVVLAALAAVIVGFIAAVIAWFAGLAGIF